MCSCERRLLFSHRTALRPGVLTIQAGIQICYMSAVDVLDTADRPLQAIDDKYRLSSRQSSRQSNNNFKYQSYISTNLLVHSTFYPFGLFIVLLEHLLSYLPPPHY